ncbi:MAG: putative penicillin acylase [Frankiales bacterium]|nr:putative penicillin acylase [Frankiales bacterium]
MPHARPLLAGLALLALVGGAGAAGAASTTGPAGLPSVTSGPRPGPDALYAPAPRAPQLENTGPWKAAPILVSGATAYRDGEWLYQDFLYDDHGATGVPDSAAPFGPGDHLYSPSAGTFTYPRDEAYAHNAADLVELRVRPLAQATAFRVTLNTLKDPARSAFTIALGDRATAAWPHGAGVSSPADVFVTWHGSAAQVIDAATGRSLGAPALTVDRVRRQVTVTVPHSAFDPGTGKVRTTIGVGLWDTEAGSYLAPAPGAATATTPGGGTPAGVALVNVGPRTSEPLPVIAGATMADTAALGAATAPWWRERQQSLQLAQGDVAPFAAEVDFAKLRAGTRDDSGVPSTGPINRLFASRHASGQGLDPTKVCFDLAAGFSAGATCQGRQVGQLQNYSLYVPTTPVPARGYGLTLLLHSLSANYNQYSNSKNQSQLGERGAGSLVLTPGGRGPDGFYAGLAETDTFEAWADVARHYRVDPDWTAVSGYSMGGFGTFRLMARWPDLFARGFSVVGAPGSADDQLVSLRNTPLLSWNAAADELVTIRTTQQTVAAMTAAGIRFEQDVFPTADHLTLAANDEYGPGAAFLGSARVDRNPRHVTYVVDPSEDTAAGRAVADHAYWLSGLRVAKAGTTGTIDAVSQASGRRDGAVLPIADGGGVVTGGEAPMAYTSQTRAWGPETAGPRADRLVVTATGLQSATVDLARAGLTCQAHVQVTTDVPLRLQLAGCGRTVSAAPKR